MCKFRRDLAAPLAATRAPEIREVHYPEKDLAAPLHQLPPEHLKQGKCTLQKYGPGSTIVLAVVGYLRSRNAQSSKRPLEMAD